MHPLEQAVHPPKRFSIKMEYPFQRRRGLHIVRGDFFMLRRKSRLSLIASRLLSKPKRLLRFGLRNEITVLFY